jgi:hypothetical protein
MAKKPTLTSLAFRDIVLGADADTIRQALEARVKIDELLAERLAAYERIAALETQIEEVIGEPGTFPYPAPPLPVAGIDAKSDTLTRAATKKSPARDLPPAAPDDENDEEEPAEPSAESDTDADTEEDDASN